MVAVAHLARRRTSSSGPSEFAAENHDFISDSRRARSYRRTRSGCCDANAMDFDDLLVKAYELLAGEDPEVLARYRERFRYIHVDEYQDTNHAQYRIVNLLAGGHRNLMVVGDDDQSIYSWRGADIRNILEFERDYPDADGHQARAELPLHEDDPRGGQRRRRATTPGRKPKTLWTANAEGESITRYTASDERDEARFVAGEIERLLRDEGRCATPSSRSSTARTRSPACSRTRSCARACPTGSSAARASSSAPRSATCSRTCASS